MRPRASKLLKWSALTTAVILAAAWITSFWYIVGISSPTGRGVWLGSGCLNFADDNLAREGWQFYTDRDFPFQHTKWWFSYMHIPTGQSPVTILTAPGEPPKITPEAWFLNIPLWLLAALALLAGALLWKLEPHLRRVDRP